MRNPLRRLLSVTLFAASTLLVIPTFAASKIDPKVVGTWHGVPHFSQSVPSQVDLEFRPGGTATMTITAKEDTIVEQGHYMTKRNILTMTFASATDNSKSIPHGKPQGLKYKVSGMTLTLDDGMPHGRVVLHRVKP